MAKSPDGAAKVQGFHRQLFDISADTLRNEIARITGVAVKEAAAEFEAPTSTFVHAFTNGTVVQFFLLADNVPADRWVFDPTYTRARFVVIDNLWMSWAVNDMDEVRAMEEDVTLRWRLVFEAGAIKVYENPIYPTP